MKNRILKYRNRILALVLSAAVLLGSSALGDLGRAKASTQGPKVSGCSLTLTAGALDLNIIFSGINDSQAGSMTARVDGVTHTLSAKQADGTYTVTHPVDAKDIAKKLTIALYRGNTKVNLTNSGATNGTVSYSVKDYLSELEPRDDATGRLAQAIDDYGTCASYYFSGAKEIPLTIKDADFSEYRMEQSGTLPNYMQSYGSSLVLTDKIAIRHYFTFTWSPTSAAASVDGKSTDAFYEAETTSTYALWYVEIPGILAWDIDHAYDLSLVMDGKQYHLKYSVLSYARDASVRNPEEPLCKLVRSIYWYNVALKNYTEELPVTEYSDYMNSKFTLDMPVAVIVLPKNATAEEQYAAKLLQKYIKEEDGYTPQLINDSVAAGTYPFEISVGNTKRSYAKATYTSNDSYCIRSYNGGIAITGVGQLGVMHGAMRFLEAFGGYYYLSWEGLYRTNQDHFKYETSGIRIDYERPFLFTDMDICYSSINPSSDLTDPYHGKTRPSGYEYPRTGRLFSLAFGLNGFYADSYCLPKTEAGRETWYLTAYPSSQYGVDTPIQYLAAGQAHTLLAEFFPKQTYFASHPEWYAAYDWDEIGTPDETRKRTEEQMCPYALLHDPEAYAVLLQHCYDMIEKTYDPNAPIQVLSISKNDGDKNCVCTNCVHERIAYGDTSGLYESVEYVKLLNKVSEDLHKDGKYPNLYLDMLAYEWTVEAPPKNLVCDDYIIVRFAPIRRCYGHYLNEPNNHVTNAKYYQELVKWTKICKHVWIWDYNTNFRTTVGPYANVDVMQHDIKLYYELGVEGVYLQSNSRHLESNSEFGDIRNYIEGRMLQDPTRNYEDELGFITDALYGQCGVYVREYMKHMEAQAKNHHQLVERRNDPNKYDTCLYATYADARGWNGKDRIFRMPDTEIGICEGLWKQINILAQNEPEEVRTRLARLELSWRLVKSTLNVYEFNTVSTYASENAKLIKDMKALDVTYFAHINGILMEQCTFTSYHPDNWANPDGDSVIWSFSSTNPGGNLSPAVPENINDLFVYYKAPK